MLQQIGSGVKFIKDYNELNILRFIKNNAPVSRAEISKRYQISKAAVSEIIARLISQGYVSEVGVGNSTKRGGRKPIILRFNEKAGYVIAIEIKRDHARIALIDMDANIHKSDTIEFLYGASFETVVQKIVPVIHKQMSDKWVTGSRGIGIGIGIPGIIDYENGCVKVSDTLHNWEKVPIRSIFQDEFKMEVVIENDVKTMTLGECLFGQGKEHNNLVNLWIGDGIGAGIIINGSLIRGCTASAGEIGYDELGFFLRDKDEFPLLYKGQKDFGDILSNKLLLESAADALKNGCKSELAPETLCLETLACAAQNNDPLASKLLREYANILGILCINLINTLNIELLIISGKLVTKCDILLDYVRERVHKDILNEPAQAVRVVPGTLCEQGIVLGASGLVLEDLFYQDNINVVKYREIFK